MIGATNTFSITNLNSVMDFTTTLAETYRFIGNNHTRLTLQGVGFTTAAFNNDEILFDSSNSTAADIVGQVHFVGHTDTAANFDIAKIVALNEVPTNATRSGLLEFRLSSSGTENDLFIDLAGFAGQINFRKPLDMNNNKIADIGETTITDLTTATGASGDLLMMVDATDGLMKKVDAVDFLGGGTTLSTLTIDVTKNWAAFGITNLGQLDMVGDIVMANNNVTGLNAIAFTDASGQIVGSSVTPHMNFVLTGTSTFRFTTNAENILDITSAGLTMLGTNAIDLAGNKVDNVGTLEFQTANITISSDAGGMNLSVPDAIDDYTFTINATDSLVLEKFFANWGETVHQMNDRTDPAAPAAGDVYFYAKLDGGIAKLFYRQSNGTIVGPLGTGGGGSQTPWLSDIDAAGFDLNNFGTLSFDVTGTDIIVDTIGMLTTVPSGDVFDWTIAGSRKLLIDTNDSTFDTHLLVSNFHDIKPEVDLGSSLGTTTLAFANAYVNKLTFDITTKFIDSVGSLDLVFEVPSSGNMFFRENGTNFWELDGDNNICKFYRDIELTAAEAIRANSSTEIGYFVTNTSASVGSAGTMQMPVVASLTPTVANLNAAFGSAIGSYGLYNTSNAIVNMAIKNLSGEWVLLAFPDAGGNVLSDHVQ